MAAFKTRAWVSGLVLVIVGAVPLALLAEYSVPHQFTAAEPAKAREVNENFAAAVTALNDLAAQLSALKDRVAALEAASPGEAVIINVPAPNNQSQVYQVPAGKTLVVYSMVSLGPTNSNAGLWIPTGTGGAGTLLYWFPGGSVSGSLPTPIPLLAGTKLVGGYGGNSNNPPYGVTIIGYLR